MSEFDPVKRVERLRKARPKRAEEIGERVPPGQYTTEKFPVLTFGSAPGIDLDTWRLRVFGLVEQPVELPWQEFAALPTVTLETDIHCVTRWSKLDTVWEGVPFKEFMNRVKPKPEAKFVMQHSFGGYTTNLALEELLEDDVLLAYKFNGTLLDPDHGGPMRMLVPKLYFWKSAKWLNGLEFMAEDKPGFWEGYGYHNHGDPWKEERFSKP
ncbi:MAG: sulfite oxidase-like oxidoreductase [Verrucomicrobia bacterium]|nr:sulfite oxidase-like oxidoreductase [Verrucomicrobiota bacterium]